ncbi:MAG: arginine decarboxylase [Methanomicrobiales archaeon]|nr:arginine decarboxylase [Methanomicrobiales archaeon]
MTETTGGRATRALIQEMKRAGMAVIEIGTMEDAVPAVVTAPDVDCVLVAWDIEGAESLIRMIRSRDKEVPVFLISEPGTVHTVPLPVIRQVNEYVWITEDTPEFIAGRVEAAALRYRGRLLPPFFDELVNFSRDFEYSWHTPGHAGGIAFLKTPAGRIFHRFFGEQLFRSDLSVSVEELGSLLDHSGPIGEAERYAAKVFGADETYFVTNGTSGSNRIIFSGSVSDGDLVLVDRNCHKSVENGITLSRSVPIYLVPARNRYGIIGPIRPGEIEPDEIAKRIASHPCQSISRDGPPGLAVITNSTYDGLCYHVPTLESLLGLSVDRILYDEAWYGYARFNPLYRDRFGMREGHRDPGDPTIFATQSTHKLLAALSQASMIHLKAGRSPVEHGRFNQAFLMHSSTSPSYPIIASLDISSRMMDGGWGKTLTDETIDEAIAFRKEMIRIRRELAAGEPGADWWFGIWQPDEIRTGEGRVAFEDADPGLLRTDPSCWTLHPEDEWHGFPGLEDNYCMLDPIKVTILTPGIRRDGSPAAEGIPAEIITRFLEGRGVIPEKTGDYNILFLFSLGITKGKWGTLLSGLFEFKRLFDEEQLLKDVLPDLAAAFPQRYDSMTVTALADEMHRFMSGNRQLALLRSAYSQLPAVAMIPAAAYARLVRGTVEKVPLDQLEDRVVATAVVPYPPGIPLLMPGERTGTADGPVIGFLRALQDFDTRFPGFSHEIHGVERENGRYLVYCVSPEAE